jgi:hypothetical protein
MAIAVELGCSQETVRRMLREDAIPGVKVRGIWKADPAKVVLALSNGYRPADKK